MTVPAAAIAVVPASASKSQAAADATALNRALHPGMSGYGTDERAIFSTLTGKTPAHLTEVKRLYREHFNVTLEADLHKDLSSHELSRAKALLSGDATQGTVEVLRHSISAGEHDELVLTLDKLPPAQLAEVSKRYAASGTPLETAISKGVLGPTKDIALALVRGQRSQADAARIDSALNLMGNSTDALQVLSNAAPAERAAVAQAYQQRTGRPLDADVGKKMRGSEKDLGVALLKGDTAGTTVAKLRHAVEGKVMGLGKDATAALALIEGTEVAARPALDARYKQAYGISLSADVAARFGGRDGDRLTKALGCKLDDVERIQIALKGYGADKAAVQSVLGGRSAADMTSLKKDFAARTGESLDGALTKELSGQALFDAKMSLEGAPETAQAAVSQATRRRDFERGGGANMASRMVMDLFSSDGSRLDKAVSDAQAALANGQTGRVAELTTLASGDVTKYRATKESVGDSVAMAAAMGATVATAGLGAPLLVGAVAGAAVSVAANAAVSGKGYQTEEIGRDAIKGSLGSLAGGSTIATGIAGKAAESAARAGLNGFIAGASDTALRSETWNGGVTDGVLKTGYAGAKSGAVSAMMSGVQSLGSSALKPAQNNVVATKFPSGEVDLSTYKADKATRAALKKGMDPKQYKLEKNVAAAYKSNHAKILKDVEAEDLVALRQYTGSEFTAMNGALRGNSPADLAKLEVKIKAASSALADMPEFKGTAYRQATMTPELLAHYKVGETVAEKAFMSTTSDKVQKFAGNTDFVIKSKGGGKMVEMISNFDAENEVLFPPGTEFKVLKVSTDAAGRNSVFLQEVK